MNLQAPISALGRVGKTTASRLKILGLKTVEDLLFYLPFRYEDWSRIVKISELKNLELATIKVKVQMIASRRSFRTRKFITEALVSDDTGTIKIVWFNQPYLSKTISVGEEIYLSGNFDENKMQMTSPDYEKVKFETTHTARIVPIYHLTAGLTEKQLRFLVRTALNAVSLFSEILPDEILKNNHFFEIKKALQEIHFPTDFENLKKAQTRLSFDRLYLRQLMIQKSRAELLSANSRSIKFLEKQTRDYVNSLPFVLTDEQKKCAWEILQDLEKSRPMNRLLNGDVGSGKTVVMSMAILNVVFNGYKAAVLAPTEILAGQHFVTLQKLFQNKNFRIALFTRSQKFINDEKVSKTKMLEVLQNGEVDLLIGTHAILSEKIKIKDLCLVVVDEQHRFGVNQRKNLTLRGEKDLVPHFLSMTATPIPRTLALTAFGDLNLSIIKHKPKNRLPIVTKFVEENRRQEIYDFIKKEIIAGRQVFVICPLIDPSDTLGVKSVKQEFERLDKNVFPEIPIGLLHGKLKSQEKEAVMQNFVNKKIKILVSTSVIEVGIDAPNATIMMIEGADRFGLSQLHQFRGRVGRGEFQSYCFVFSDNQSFATQKRLKYLEEYADGFALSEIDLELRGSGDIYGQMQSGFSDLQNVDFHDVALIELAQKEAQKTLKNNWLNENLQKKLTEISVNNHFE
ncbi:MAG: ATP-dependent DNA helicase RecG [Patescibacteria group bacterium]